MSHLHRIATLIAGLVVWSSLALAQGSAMLVSAEDATVIIDGSLRLSLEAYAPERVELAAGSHRALATNVDDLQTELTFEITEGAQQLVQIDFSEAKAERARVEAMPKPVVIADTSLLVPRAAPFDGSRPSFAPESEVYQAFVKGDKVQIDAQVEGGGNFFVELIRYTDWSPVHMHEDQDGIEGITFDIDQTGMYILRVGSRSLTDEVAQITVTRIPAAKETESLDTRVSMYVQFEVVQLIDPQMVYVSAKSQRDNRKEVALDLGANLFEWYYTFSVHADETAAQNDLRTHRLVDDLRTTVDRLQAIKAKRVEGLEIGMQAIDHPSGSLPADVYLMTPENARKFAEEELFVYILKESFPDATDGEVKVKCCTKGAYVLGFRNMDVYQGVYIAVQAVGLRKGLYLARDATVD